MISWSATMSLTQISKYVLATWLLTTVGAITVSIDRSDIKTSPTRSSMIANGWRPLANGYEDSIGTNVQSAVVNHLDRNLQQQPHPVLSKLQEHMLASEKHKPHRNNKNKPSGSSSSSQQDYSPPSILGSFTVFGNAAAKARGEPQKVSQQQQQQQQQQGHVKSNVNKYVGSETREYTFLIPPPKDVYRFEHSEPPRKVVRDNSYSIVNDFLRQPAYVPPQVHQVIPDAVRAATYFIKGYTSTANPTQVTSGGKIRPHSSSSSSSSSSSFFNGYSGVPQILQPPRHPAKPFESLKISGNAKPYLQPPSSEITSDFVKDDRLNEHKRRPGYDRFQPSQINGQSGNFYTQINHPTNHYKTSYERDPSFLVHESHELSYVTPSSIYNNEYNNFRPSVPYDTLLPPEVYSTSSIGTSSTTIAPPVHQETSSKYLYSNDVVRDDDYYKNIQSTSTTTTTIKQPDNTVPTSGITNTYYVSEQQDLTPPPQSWPITKNKYTSDINEVLPRVNPPNKFSPDVIQPSQLPQVPKMVYVRPQVQQYQSSIVPSQQEYETPESISLKHFNEQQFIIQQQLVQRDRQRLAEQERQQQLEIERQQQEELKKHQEELDKLIKQQKEEEEQQIQQQQQQQQQGADEFSADKNITEQIEFSKIGNGQTPYTVQFTQFDIPRVTSQSPIHYNEQNTFEENNKSHGSQIQQPEAAIVPLKTSFENQQYQTQFNYNQQQQQQYNNNYQQELNNPQQEYVNQEYVNYRETELPSQKQHKPPSRDSSRRKKPVTTISSSSVGYESAITTEVPTQQPETLVPYTFPVEELPSTHTTASPEPITFPSSFPSTTSRSRTRRPGGSSGGGGGSGQRRRRPSTTTPEPVTVLEGEYYEKYDEQQQQQQQQQLDSSKRRRVKPTQQTTNEETHLERRPNIRKRPGNRIRVNHGEPYEAEIVTEVIQTPVNIFKDNTEQQQHSDKYVDDNRYTSNLPHNQYHDYTSPVSQYNDDHRDYTTEIIQSEYQTELTKNNNDKSHGSNNNNHYNNNHYHHRQNNNNPNVVTNIPLEDLFVKTDGYYFDNGATTSSPTIASSSTTTTTTTTTPTPTPTPSPPPPSSPPPTTTSIVKTVTQSSHVSSTTSRLKIRPMRFGNTTRPRFSIKDYKTRMDYKNRLAQTSTTEPTTPTVQSKQRHSSFKSQSNNNQQQQHNDYSNKENTGRYKYMSRTNHRTTTINPINESENNFDDTSPTSSTTERPISRFIPKRRPINNNLYRSRISATSTTTSNPNRSQQQVESENNSKTSTVRSENVFSSSIRRRPVNKNRHSTYKESNNSNYRDSNNNNNNNNNKEELSTEMTAEETSFYSPMTTSASSIGHTTNDIVHEKNHQTESSNSDDVVNVHTEEENQSMLTTIKEQSETTSVIPMKIIDDDTDKKIVQENNNQKNKDEITTHFDVTKNNNNNNDDNEEELFAKASQSVADLTSSASALYDKPGMFKAVSPESRVVSPHFKITTDEPTLPIEAFFQELSKKN
ncbi:PREDICTED: dual specificity protein kinase splA-like [Polistes dominula]|uniref:Dual specificity protein kinase splA-like n=1 Tax=Polistes dominula TaxID=743375 RepID=A0ABM1I2K2_POLDO|nr:PREDICTED: dual specificity protein kinase splA-like [Polistes dominula]